MPTLRTARVRRALSDPNRAPPGTTAPTFGAGLTVTGDAVVAVDFGAGAAQVPTGTKVPGTIPVDTRGATDGDALRYDAGEGAFVPSADASLGALAQLDAGEGLAVSGGDAVVDTGVIASRAYVDATVGGLLYKAACRAVAITNVASRAGTTTVDGVALVAGDRVLLTAQSTKSQNGPWIVAAGAWSRPAVNELQASAAFPVSEGTTYADSIWYVTTNDPLTPDVSEVMLARASMAVTTSGITDSGAAGRAVVQASTAAAVREAAGVQDGPRRIALLAGRVSTTTSVGHDGVGDGYLDPAEHAIEGRVLATTLEAVGQVVAGVTGTLVLYDLTADESVATLSWTETSAARKTASVSVPNAAHVYELRLSKSGGGANDYALVGGVHLLLTWS